MRVSRSLGILRKLRYIFPGSILRLLLCSLVQSYVSYCSVIWISTFPSSLKALSKLYDKARTLIQETNRFSLKPLLDLKFLYFLSCSPFVFLQLHRHVPAVLCNNISFVTDQSTYHLRTSNNFLVLHTPSVRSDFSPLTACNRIWNTRSCHSFGMFKNYVREFLASK